MSEMSGKTMKVKIKKLHPNAVVPKQATEFSGGWDVVATEIEEISPNYVICKLGIAMTPPRGYKITIVPRSSLTKTGWIIPNSPCLGDEDFTSEYQLRFRTLPEYSDFPYKVGDRIGQMYLEEVIPIEFEEVDELNLTERKGGFGSTG